MNLERFLTNGLVAFMLLVGAIVVLSTAHLYGHLGNILPESPRQAMIGVLTGGACLMRCGQVLWLRFEGKRVEKFTANSAPMGHLDAAGSRS